MSRDRIKKDAYSVTCHCGEFSAQRAYERDAWDALHAHLKKAHGHDVHAQKERTT